MDNQPLLSVLMPVFNSELFVAEAIESILSQTFNDFEFLILDDASTDNSFKITKDFESKDSRIKVYQNEKNLGVVESRNKLINLSKGKYIAWIDSDDIAIKNRFEKQINFLETHPAIGLVGAWLIKCDKFCNPQQIWPMETDPEKLQVDLFFHSPFSTVVMIRRSDLPDKLYDSRFPVAEDYDLYCRIAEKSGVANLGLPLLKFRENYKSLSHTTKVMEDRSSLVIKEHAERLGITLDEKDIKNFRKIVTRSRIDIDDINHIEKSLSLLKNLLLENDRFDKTAVTEVIQEYWFETCRKSTHNGLKVLSIFFSSPLFCKKISLKDNCRLFVRALIRF
ncbi:glycosyltransferase family 2 protein [bacterium]|nr:glycosyltransferase family 2 protein [bacterium]